MKLRSKSFSPTVSLPNRPIRKSRSDQIQQKNDKIKILQRLKDIQNEPAVVLVDETSHENRSKKRLRLEQQQRIDIVNDKTKTVDIEINTCSKTDAEFTPNQRSRSKRSKKVQVPSLVTQYEQQQNNVKTKILQNEKFNKNEPPLLSFDDAPHENLSKERPHSEQQHRIDIVDDGTNTVDIEINICSKTDAEFTLNRECLQKRSKKEQATSLVTQCEQQQSNVKTKVLQNEKYMQSEAALVSFDDTPHENLSKERPRSEQQHRIDIVDDGTNTVDIEINICSKTDAEFTPIRKCRPIRSKKVQATSLNTQCEKKIEKRITCKIDLKRLDSYEFGSIVLVKWPSFPYWPARITDICNKSVDVIFFGDNNRTAKVNLDRIFDFRSNVQYIVKTLKSRQWKSIYMKAIRETEIYADIPFEMSLVNEIDS